MDTQTTNYLNSDQQSVYTPTSDERTLAILAHVLTLLFSFLAPLVVYLIKKDDSKYVAEQAKESLNFQISLCIYFAVSFILMIVIIGIFLLAVLGIFSFILIIVASIKASDNKIYRYPLTIRLIK